MARFSRKDLPPHILEQLGSGGKKKRTKAEKVAAKKQSDATIALRLAFLKSHGLGDWVAEHKFCEGRKWPFDFARPDLLIAIEIQGGVWIQGRHSRGKGQISDMDKSNVAQAMGWKVIQCTPKDFDSGKIIPRVREMMNSKGWKNQ